MDVPEIMRLAGAEDDAESFQVALEGAPRPGAPLAVTQAAKQRRSLDEKRGYMPKPFNPNADRVYYRLCVAVNALAEVNGVVCDLWKRLDRMRYGDDPEQGFGEAAGKILDGPLTDVEKMVKAAGYALDKRFDTRGEHEYTPPGMGLKLSSLSSGNLDTLCLHLRGEVAEAMTVLKIVAPELDKLGDRDLPEMDRDLWKKAWPALQKIDARVDVLAEAIEKLIAKKMSPRPGMMDGEEMYGYEHSQLAQGAALAEELQALPPERPNWGSGLSGGAPGGFERLAVPSFGAVALVPHGDDGYEVRSLREGRLGALSYGMIRSGHVAHVVRGHEKLMEATLKAAIAEAQAAQSTQQHLDRMAEGAPEMVGKAFAQKLGHTELWLFGVQALRNGSLKGSLVRAHAEQRDKPEKAVQDSYTMADMTAYKPVLLKDVPQSVAARWKDSGALKEASENLAVLRETRAVVVVRLSVPARKPSGASDAASWTEEEQKMAADFELALERTALKTEKAPKVAVKVSKIGFEGTGSKYAMKATVELSGEGVSSSDDDLISALDKRAEAALDNVVKHGEQAADAAFGDLNWSHATLEVM